jgi:Icc-related predicted phosphoesterase
MKGRDVKRILYASDFHGSTRTWRKLLNAVAVYEADAIMVGGDLTGKGVVPIVRQSRGFSARFLGSDCVLASEDEKARLMERIIDVGLYPYETDPDEMTALANDRSAADAIFDRLMVSRLMEWADLAAERLPADVPLLIIPGNDDLESVDRILEDSAAFTMVHERVVDLFEDYQVAGIGFSNMSPWHAPRDLTEAVLAASIERTVAGIRDYSKAIFMFHCPPRDTALDECMAIDANLKPLAGGTVTAHVGSTAVREAITKYQPLLGLHGHIHESRGISRLGRCACINAGSEYSEGILRAAIVQLQPSGKIGHLFVTS